MDIKQVKNILQEDINKNINIINFIESYPIDKVDIHKSSILIRGKSDHNWVYISTQSPDDLTNLVRASDDKYFAAVEDWMIPYISKDKKIEWQLNCLKLIYSKEVDKTDILHKVKKLSIDDAEYIYNNSHYKNFTNLDYIKERITKGISLGIYDNKKLVAWILTHDDGAIGFLNVLEEYRGNGHAKSLTLAIINKLQNEGKVPFVHIENSNIKSMSLSKKLGFKEFGKVSWVKLK